MRIQEGDSEHILPPVLELTYAARKPASWLTGDEDRAVRFDRVQLSVEYSMDTTRFY